jgi:hypothetical protein
MRAIATVAAAALFAGCGGGATDDGNEGSGTSSRDTGASAAATSLVHVHGLARVGDVLLIATHNGLYELEGNADEPRVVGETLHDLMGFTVSAPDRFLASGHPDLRGMREDELPPHLGLIESRDGGKTWQSVSLLGEADFHILRAAGERVYGYDATHGRLLLSTDEGHSWVESQPPGPLFDLVVDPQDPDHLVASGERGLHRSLDGGHSWERVGDEMGLLAWPDDGPLYLVAPSGAVSAWSAVGAWQEAGGAGGEPAAFLAAGPRELYVALHGGGIVHSLDGGKSWTARTVERR